VLRHFWDTIIAVRVERSTMNSRSALSDAGRVTLRKVTLRLIPFLFILYVVAWLDRVNVGFAGLQMNADLGFSSAAFGFGSGVFFLGYCLFEVPSNLVLHRVGATSTRGRRKRSHRVTLAHPERSNDVFGQAR